MIYSFKFIYKELAITVFLVSFIATVFGIIYVLKLSEISFNKTTAFLQQ